MLIEGQPLETALGLGYFGKFVLAAHRVSVVCFGYPSKYAVSSAICTDTQFDVSPLAKQPPPRNYMLNVIVFCLDMSLGKRGNHRRVEVAAFQGAKRPFT